MELCQRIEVPVDLSRGASLGLILIGQSPPAGHMAILTPLTENIIAQVQNFAVNP